MEDLEVKLTLKEYTELIEARAALKLRMEMESRSDREREDSVVREAANMRAVDQLLNKAMDALKPIIEDIISDSKLRREKELRFMEARLKAERERTAGEGCST